ncbi:MAG: hypothetical protein LBC61_02355 [Candidatus Peribacteria bacterium]|nr:hypothetical protein [Candidatus Peribacteria bacterium]
MIKSDILISVVFGSERFISLSNLSHLPFSSFIKSSYHCIGGVLPSNGFDAPFIVSSLFNHSSSQASTNVLILLTL